MEASFLNFPISHVILQKEKELLFHRVSPKNLVTIYKDNDSKADNNLTAGDVPGMCDIRYKSFPSNFIFSPIFKASLNTPIKLPQGSSSSKPWFSEQWFPW